MVVHEGNFNVEPEMVINGRFCHNMPDIIEGNFYCSYLNLTTLEGGPRIVKKNFTCANNLLSSLKGGPEEVGENFNCSNNLLTNLEGCPDKVRSFYGAYNKLNSLEGGPKIVNGTFNISNNLLQSLEHGPYFTKEGIYIFENITNLDTEMLFLEDNRYEKHIIDTSGEKYWFNLATFILKHKYSFDSVKGWPKDFDLKSMKTSANSINKFKL